MILIGSISYMWIENWSFLDALYMTVMTLTTIGFAEVHPLSKLGRLFTIFFSLMGFFILAGSITILSSAIVEGNVLGIIRRKKMFKKISKTKKHIIICGAGRIGKHVIHEVMKSKKKFVVIDHDKNYIDELMKTKGLTEKNGDFLFIEGDATKEEILIQAGITNASGLISCLAEDSQNLFISLTAKHLNPKIKVSAYVIEEQNTEKFFMIGVDEVVSGNFIIGKRLAISMMKENILSFLDQVTFVGEQAYYLGDVTLKDNSPISGKSLREAAITQNVGLLVFAIKSFNTNKYQFNPNPNSILKMGDVLVVMGTSNDLEKLEKYVNN